jgi:NAD(P)-dependent dehydrogenase (short-subunit alcohol dehydrogenase family)
MDQKPSDRGLVWSRGIGRAIAVALAQAGADVAIVYNNGREAAEKVCDEVRKAGVRARAHKADVADEEQVNILAEGLRKDFGPVSIIVNCASSWPPLIAPGGLCGAGKGLPQQRLRSDAADQPDTVSGVR